MAGADADADTDGAPLEPDELVEFLTDYDTGSITVMRAHDTINGMGDFPYTLDDLLAGAGLSLTDGSIIYIYRHCVGLPRTDPSTGYLDTGDTFKFCSRLRKYDYSESGSKTEVENSPVYQGDPGWEEWNTWFLSAEGYGSVWWKSYRVYRSLYDWFNDEYGGPTGNYMVNDNNPGSVNDLNQKLRSSWVAAQNNDNWAGDTLSSDDQQLTYNHPYVWRDMWEHTVGSAVYGSTVHDVWAGGGSDDPITTYVPYTYYPTTYWKLKDAIRERFKTASISESAYTEYTDAQCALLGSQQVFAQSAWNTKMQIAKPLRRQTFSALHEGEGISSPGLATERATPDDPTTSISTYTEYYTPT